MLKLVLQMVPVLIFSYTAQVLLKRGAESIGAIDWSLLIADPVFVLRSVVLEWQVVLGFLLAAIGAVLYLVVLSQTDLTVALPVLGALGFLVLPVVGMAILQESASPRRILGTVVIAVGMIIVASS